MEIKIVQQPNGSSICGQCCVAMVTGKPVEEVIKVFGHSKATRTKELHKALAYFGYSTNERLIRARADTPFPDFGILKITYDDRKNNGHWVVIHNRLCYCPSGNLFHWSNYGGPMGRITSYLTIQNPNQ